MTIAINGSKRTLVFIESLKPITLRLNWQTTNNIATKQANNQSLISLTNVIQLTLTLKMTTAQVVETSVTAKNSPAQDFVHPNDQYQPTYEMTTEFKPFRAKIICCPQKGVKMLK